MPRSTRHPRCSGLAAAGLCGLLLAAAPARATAPDERAYLAPARELSSGRFWWPTVVLERASTHLTGARSVDETRFGLSLAYRTGTLSPHVRALISPSIDRYQDLAAMMGVGLRVHFELAGVPVSYGTGLSLEARLRDSLWLAYATPIELGTALYRGDSAEHYVFVGARHSLAGALINSYLLDPNGYESEAARAELHRMRDGSAWQIYVALVFGRRVE
jgi:hypothetical protein